MFRTIAPKKKSLADMKVKKTTLNLLKNELEDTDILFSVKHWLQALILISEL